MSDDFWQQYKHPSWQKRRLEVLNKASWSCEDCGANDVELHVHHKAYKKGRKVWEYSDSELDVLCDVCHSKTHELLGRIKSELAECKSSYETILGVLQALNTSNESVLVDSYDQAGGIGMVLGISMQEVMGRCNNREFVFGDFIQEAVKKLKKEGANQNG